MKQPSERARPDTHPTAFAPLGFVVGAAATAIAGILVQLGIEPTSDLSEEFWRYPWESSGAFVTFSLISAVLHALIIVGLVAFGRSGVAGSSPASRRGVNLAITGTSLLLLGELASIPVHNALTDDTEVIVVGSIFGLATVCSTVGFLISGATTIRASVWTDWRRFAPIATGIWLAIMIPLTFAEPTVLPGSVAVYGLCLLTLAVGMAMELATSSPRV